MLGLRLGRPFHFHVSQCELSLPNVRAKVGITPLNEGIHDGIKEIFMFVSRNLHGAPHGLTNQMKGCKAISKNGHVSVGMATLAFLCQST